MNTDFVNFGTYINYEADILKQELEKNNIAVKTLYPGTSIGKETSGETGWTSYTLLIRECDIEKANEIKEGIGIEIAQTIPFVPISRSIAKPGHARFLTITGIIFFLAAIITGIFGGKYFFGLGLLMISILMFTINSILIFIPKKEKYEQQNKEDNTNRG
ncbi:MAG: hypothetical protein PHS27_01295 [Candidatus Pacebacteria bacterium]|nr:hypothetical protein [Candidatus Paceibacterota bacterium]